MAAWVGAILAGPWAGIVQAGRWGCIVMVLCISWGQLLLLVLPASMGCHHCYCYCYCHHLLLLAVFWDPEHCPHLQSEQPSREGQ